MWTPRWGALRVTAAPLAAPAPAALATLLLALALLTSSCQPAMSAQGNTASSSSASSFAAHVHASIGSSTTTIGTSRTSSTTTISGGPQQQFSLFLSPHGALGRQLAAEIDALAAQHPPGPSFPPHVTLLGLVEAEWGDMQRIAKQLARSMQVGVCIRYDAFRDGLLVADVGEGMPCTIPNQAGQEHADGRAKGVLLEPIASSQARRL